MVNILNICTSSIAVVIGKQKRKKETERKHERKKEMKGRNENKKRSKR